MGTCWCFPHGASPCCWMSLEDSSSHRYTCCHLVFLSMSWRETAYWFINWFFHFSTSEQWVSCISLIASLVVQIWPLALEDYVKTGPNSGSLFSVFCLCHLTVTYQLGPSVSHKSLKAAGKSTQWSLCWPRLSHWAHVKGHRCKRILPHLGSSLDCSGVCRTMQVTYHLRLFLLREQAVWLCA